VPSMRARPASDGYCGATSWIRFASATREAIRILLTGVGSGIFAGAGTLRVLLRTALNTPPGIPPTTPPGTPPTTPLLVPTGGGGASWVLCTVGMAMLVGVNVDAGWGA